MVRFLEDKDMPDFIDLHKAMLTITTGRNVSYVETLATMNKEMMQQGYICIVAENKDKDVVGFVSGYLLSKDVWHLSGIYSEIPIYVKSMLDFLYGVLRKNGVKIVMTEENKNVIPDSRARKWGFEVEKIIYRKNITPED
jgi:hypothetical protein